MQGSTTVAFKWRAVMDATGNTIVAWVDRPPGNRQAAGTIYVSDDGGMQWTPRTPAGNVSWYWSDVAVSADGMRMAARPSTLTYLSRGVAFFWLSSDAGNTWEKTVVSGARHLSADNLAMSRDGQRILIPVQALGRDLFTDRFGVTPMIALSSDFGRMWQLQPIATVHGENPVCSATCSTLLFSSQVWYSPPIDIEYTAAVGVRDGSGAAFDVPPLWLLPGGLAGSLLQVKAAVSTRNVG
jgi:hypothetical protein